MSYAVHLLRADEGTPRSAGVMAHAPASAFALARRACERAAGGQATIALLGEEGTDKEGLARFIHAFSPRAGGPFVPLHCSHGQNLESELGASFGGSLFLDDIAALPPAMQVMLARVLQQSIAMDFRLIVGTSRDLAKEVEAGDFRRDLYDLLFVNPIRVPSLRERPEDIPILLQHFWTVRGETRPVDPQVMLRLASYSFPGDVRELEDVVERISTGSQGARITLSDLPDFILSDQEGDDLDSGEVNQAAAPAGGNAVFEQGDFPRMNITLPIKLPEMLRALENAFIDSALMVTGNNRKEAARLLGMGRTTLVEKLRRRGPSSGQEHP